MRIDVLTLFPDMFESPFSSSITKRAIEANILDIHLTNFRDFSFDKHKHVDDSPFGGGAGMEASSRRKRQKSLQHSINLFLFAGTTKGLMRVFILWRMRQYPSVILS